MEFVFDGRVRRSVVSETQCISVFLLSDNLVENDEVFTVHLSTMDSSVNLSPDYADVVILNNDRKKTL